MKRILDPRSLITFALLLLAASAFVSGIKTGVENVIHAAFLPVAVFATASSFVLGHGSWSTRRAWSFLATCGLFVIYIEAARLYEPLQTLFLAIPRAEFALLRGLFERSAPDISFLFPLLSNVAEHSNDFFTSLVTEAQGASPSTLREVLWDLPILFLSGWAGWWMSRHNQVLTALAPSLALHALILDYTAESTISLQSAAFALIFLFGINQRWNLGSRRSENFERTARETYSTILILSFALALGAGFMPSISIRDAAEKYAERDRLSEALGLERTDLRSYAPSATGLPRQHLVGSSPARLQNVVFVVRTGERSFLLDREDSATFIPPRHYWRWLVYDVYNGQDWTTSPVKSNTYAANAILFPLKGDRYQIVHQQVEKVSALDNHLYWTGALARADRSFESSWRVAPDTRSSAPDPLLQADMLGALTPIQNYSADSLILIVSEAELRGSSGTYPADVRRRYLSLPESVPQRVLQLATELTSGGTNPYDKAKAIESYLRTYPYSLDVPPAPLGRDVADYFLFDLRTGYCDYYATSMVVLARAAGLPARIVIGYSSGDYDRIRAEYVVREANAHSWVEVYFNEIGWVEFEPTANQPAISRPAESSQDGLSLQPLSTREDTQRQHYARKGRFFQRNHLPLLIGLASILAYAGGRALHSQGFFRSHATIASIYDHIYYHGKRIYVDAPLHETPSAFAIELKKRLAFGSRWLRPAARELDVLTGLYIREIYSPHPVSEAEQRQAIRIWRRLIWRLLFARIRLRERLAKPAIGPAKNS